MQRMGKRRKDKEKVVYATANHALFFTADRVLDNCAGSGLQKVSSQSLRPYINRRRSRKPKIQMSICMEVSSAKYELLDRILPNLHLAIIHMYYANHISMLAFSL